LSVVVVKTSLTEMGEFDIVVCMVYIRCMLRTQVYLPEALRQELDIVAKKEKKPTAQIIRELLSEGVRSRHKETVGEALTKLADLGVKGGPSNLSTNIDKYLYE